MAPHSSTLVWKIPWTEEPGELQSMGSQRVRYDSVANTHGASSCIKRCFSLIRTSLQPVLRLWLVCIHENIILDYCLFWWRKNLSEDLTDDESLSSILIIDRKKCLYVYIYTQKHTQWIVARGIFVTMGSLSRFWAFQLQHFRFIIPKSQCPWTQARIFPASRVYAKSCHWPACSCIRGQGWSSASSPKSFGRPEGSPQPEPVRDDLAGRCLKESRTSWPFVWLRDGLFLPQRQIKHIVRFAMCFSL